MINIALEITVAIISVMRLSGSKDVIFQAVAHLLVGGLFGAWLANRAMRHCLWLAIFLTVVEIVAFVASRVIA